MTLTRPLAYDHVIFDTAPTGHTLRLLALPAAWSGFIDTNTSGVSCLGPLAGLQDQAELYAASVRALSDPQLTTLVLVSRPERTALAEAERTRAELAGAGMRHQILALNGIFDTNDSDDQTALALAHRRERRPGRTARRARRSAARRGTAARLRADRPRRALPRPRPDRGRVAREQAPDVELPGAPLSELIDELEVAGRGVIMTMGKGGVGKTTLAAAIASELARRGHPVHLSTTDPAAHVADAVGDGMPATCRVSRIDPADQTRIYYRTSTGRRRPRPRRPRPRAARRGPPFALHRGDRRVPRVRRRRRTRPGRFVVLDTAPTGHSLLLLDATESYHRDVARGLSQVPDAVAQLLPRLRDPEYTRVLIITLPEATPDP